ncbi:MAG: hypothetical protein GY765_32500, partial [bacterium]|nr:hypothetical protein [bacterium]
MSKIKQFFMPMLVLVFVLSLGLSMSAVEKSELKVIADANISAGGLYLQPRVYYSQATLTISGPDGYVFSKTFDSGSSLYQGLSDDQGAMLRDGSYTYELTVIQSASKLVRGESGNEAGLERNNGQKQQPLVQSGYFTVRGGSMVTARSEGTPGFRQGIQDEGNVADDQVILDDLIVDGSICVGQDCTSGESFGFDTIRLKENNLRIKFQDTSSSSSFPSNDWQITANDSANGGANKFSIDDIDGGRTPFTIEAASPTNSLYVDSSGRIGLGTATPTVEVHVVDGDSPTLRLEQDGSSGFTPQTWDVAGNESNFFVRDVTNGSQLPFKIRPGADGDSLVLEANSDVSLGGTGSNAIVTVDDSEK